MELIASLPQPVGWRDVVNAAEAISPRDITNLRKMLKGLERQGDLGKDAHGDYVLLASQEMCTGEVARNGRNLSVDGMPLDEGMNLSIRPGDQVSYRVSQGRVRIQEVLAYAATPVAGVARTAGKYPYVDLLGDFRGRVSIENDMPEISHGQTVAVKIVGRRGRNLVGEYLHVLEGESVLDQAIETTLLSHQIPYQWPDGVLKAVSKLPTTVQPGRFPQRKDLMDLPLVTIDGETAKDFDDAVFAERQGRGWRLVVAIADVAHYVKMASPLDDEAVLRGTSVYFPERVVPMLPEEISNGLCSLRPETPRLALVCDMRVSQVGKVTQHEFYEAVIYSHARLTYTQVQSFLDGGAELRDSKVAASVTELNRMFQAMTAAREARGALDFPTRESAMTISQGRVSSISVVKRVDAHRLIEEAMIAANVCAAEFLQNAGLSGLYRVHEPPDPMKLDELRQALAYAGVRLKAGDVQPGDLQAALSRLPATANLWLYGQMALRTMQQAVYTPDNQGHYGLALSHYMHFTSPIRRYPDLVVHRLIKAELAWREKRKPPKTPDDNQLHWLGTETSSHERRAESAGWMVDAWLKCDFLSDRIGEKFQGTIATVTDFGLFVELEGYFVQGLVHVSNLGTDYFVFNARAQSLVGERSGRKFAMGDSLQVELKEVEPAQGRIDLLLAGQKQQKEKVRPSKHKGQKKNKHGKPGANKRKSAQTNKDKDEQKEVAKNTGAKKSGGKKKAGKKRRR